MSYDDTPDVVFNSQGDVLLEASELFQDIGVEPHYYNLPFGNPSLERCPANEADLPLRPDGKSTGNIFLLYHGLNLTKL